MGTGLAGFNGTLGDRLEWALEHPTAAVQHEHGREAGYAIGHGAAVALELGERAHDARTVENDAGRLAPKRAPERLAGLLRTRRAWGERRATPQAVDPGVGSDRPLFDAFLPERERAGAGLPAWGVAQ